MLSRLGLRRHASLGSLRPRPASGFRPRGRGGGGLAELSGVRHGAAGGLAQVSGAHPRVGRVDARRSALRQAIWGRAGAKQGDGGGDVMGDANIAPHPVLHRDGEDASMLLLPPPPPQEGPTSPRPDPNSVFLGNFFYTQMLSHPARAPTPTTRAAAAAARLPLRGGSEGRPASSGPMQMPAWAPPASSSPALSAASCAMWMSGHGEGACTAVLNRTRRVRRRTARIMRLLVPAQAANGRPENSQRRTHRLRSSSTSTSSSSDSSSCGGER